MSGDVHVRFCEHLEGRFLRVTRLIIILVKSQRAPQGRADERMQLPGIHRPGHEDTLDRQGTGQLQAPGPGADGTKPGPSPDRNSPEDCLCLARGRASGPARPARGSMEYRLHKLGQVLRGWTAYFGLSQYYRPVPELDDWIRRRVRMCYWKQWRWVRTKIKHLLALGVSLKTAIQHAASRKSWWHMARTPALQQAPSNAWLKAQGLVSVKDLWCKAQGYTT